MRVLIVDDQTQFLDVLSSILMQIPDIEAVCSALGGREGVRLAAELKPDLVLTDFSMPDVDGMVVTRHLKGSSRPPQVVMMSFHAEQEYRDMARQAGVDAYLVKADLHEDLVPLLKLLAAEKASRKGFHSTLTFDKTVPRGVQSRAKT